jgi:5-methylcytosine-specific restriction enzyme A
MALNPKWTRDELILALELYKRVNPIHTSEKHPEIIALSELLNSLPLLPSAQRGEKFRNPNGVYMKLCNFLRFDPGYAGTGLQRGGKLEKEIWEEFANDHERLTAAALGIKDGARILPPPADEEELLIDEEEEFPEGRLLTQMHRRQERNPLATKKKKKAVLMSKGFLACEACGFDFRVTYGILGDGFAECHHQVPLSKLRATRGTKFEDLSIVCANCHRMLHRARPWKTVDELRALIGANKSI